MILQTAQENNVQVLATTHSWDCVTGFAQAASELEDVEGVLVRLSRSGGDLRAVEYPEEELAIAAEQGIELPHPPPLYGNHPVPLRSLGDGALRLLGVAVTLANSRGGFLLIDEAENGIHHTIQRDYWRMILQTAQENNVQVLATTHSWDCVTGFAQAASELEDVEGVLVRLSRSGGDLRAVEYPVSFYGKPYAERQRNTNGPCPFG